MTALAIRGIPLDVSFNHIENVNHMFELYSAKINVLDLSHNLIRKIKTITFYNLVTKKLILHHNLLEDLSFLGRMRPVPDFVDLRNNKLFVISNQEIQILRSIKAYEISAIK